MDLGESLDRWYSPVSVKGYSGLIGERFTFWRHKKEQRNKSPIGADLRERRSTTRPNSDRRYQSIRARALWLATGSRAPVQRLLQLLCDYWLTVTRNKWWKNNEDVEWIIEKENKRMKIRDIIENFIFRFKECIFVWILLIMNLI